MTSGEPKVFLWNYCNFSKCAMGSRHLIFTIYIYIYILIHNMTYTHTYTWHIFFFPLYSLNMLQYTSIYKLYASENHFNWSCMWAWARVTFAPSSQQKALKTRSLFCWCDILLFKPSKQWRLSHLEWYKIKQDAKAASKTERVCKQNNIVVVWNDNNFKIQTQNVDPQRIPVQLLLAFKNTKPTPNEQLLPFFEPRYPIRSCPILKCCEPHHAFLPRSCFFGGIWPSTHWTWKMATTNFICQTTRVLRS